jgi:hypothetical protein
MSDEIITHCYPDTTSRLFNIYNNVKYFSIKHASYFQVYEKLLGKYVGKNFTFVEVGVYHGGSLFMWREYFGPQARIIGIDINPNTKKWEKEGFEIFIGDQADPEFWRSFFAQVGKIDVLLEDGGHTNLQQITTAVCAVDHINDGGLIFVEDLQTNYLKKFGNPSKYSFINFTRRIIDSINSRWNELTPYDNRFRNQVFCIEFFESIVALHIDRRRCFTNTIVPHPGTTEEFGYVKERHELIAFLRKCYDKLRHHPRFRNLTQSIDNYRMHLSIKRQNFKARKYFK